MRILPFGFTAETVVPTGMTSSVYGYGSSLDSSREQLTSASSIAAARYLTTATLFAPSAARAWFRRSPCRP